MRKIVAALALGILLGTAAMQISAAIPTAPMSTPAEVIAQVNRYLGNQFSLSSSTGEMQFFASQSWAANSSTATSVTSVGPTGANTTVSKWLVVKDNTGAQGYMPWFKCNSAC